MVNSNGEKGIVFNDAHEIVARRFPDAVKDGISKTKGTSRLSMSRSIFQSDGTGVWGQVCRLRGAGR